MLDRKNQFDLNRKSQFNMNRKRQSFQGKTLMSIFDGIRKRKALKSNEKI